MIACSVQKVTKMYGGNSVVKNISFEIKVGDRVGLVGRNGSGKTTLLKLLAGEETPDSGQVHWKKGSQIGYMKQISDFNNQLTTKEILKSAFLKLLRIEENMKSLETQMSEPISDQNLQRLMNEYGRLQDLYLSEGGYEIEATIRTVVSGLNMTGLLNKQFFTLSGGEKTKVELAFMLLKKPDFLLLDEPTNHLDLASVEWLGNFLQNYHGTIVMVSHDRYFLDEMVNKILDLDEGEIQYFETNYSDYVKKKEERLLREFHAYKEQQKKIKKMKEAIKRLRDWANRSNPPSEGLHKRARNMERALERMEKLNQPTLHRKKMNLEMESSNRSGNDVIVLQDVSKSLGDQQLFELVNMHITYQQRVAIVGENGTGKSTLIKLILQQLNPDEGEVKIGNSVKIGYLSQHVFSNMGDETIIDAFRNEVIVVEGLARQILARFLFYGHSVFKKVSQLSGGEKMRLRLAQLMHQDTNLLILDEPTNHLDIESLEVLEDALENYNGTILAVSHDRYFLNKLFEKIYWIKSKKVYCFEGNYGWAKKRIEIK
ncbi:ribosomal protection-like ABC-F family protein [Cytobacillus purgationiresistens]|uniref:ATPase subunit of ABC transporter with duplicated ATPase domains n=1 Tax=Cytobacillus purgationiresistens TaxID=863449 RepID=A0ABU0ARC1_9BACI|nr:ABC-F type ribosomal protection protein [Cytobacillus purgationiresistens]MDQ0273758.1 ATPase subunit of ABC transporter with duplicated ATPase domains [Cytobacillus purgationiresistens]